MIDKIILRLKAVFFRRKLSTMSREGRFTEIYNAGWWKNNAESVSGSGSTLDNTDDLRSWLPNFLQKHNITSVLDAPCGDFNWMQHVELPESVTYLGADIVRPLIEELNENYSSDKISFHHLDITKDALPDVDLLFCRDCLFHLSNEDIKACFENFIASKIPMILTTFMPSIPKNKDIQTGQYRPLNLTKSPFNLPQPKLYMMDYKPPRLEKYMALWTREDIIEALLRK